LDDLVKSFLIENLPNPETTKMKGNNPFHKVRVGDYRIVYEIQEEVLVILVVKIGHRKDIYRKLS
jgi:mRNA interferase RelE/StbE